MKPSDLLTVWNAPDNSRLTGKQFSFRLPVHVAARIAALCELYPSKSRTQIVGDLLAAALDEVQRNFPEVQGAFFTTDPDTGNDLFEDVGPVAQFRKLSNKHFKELEAELGTEQPGSLFQALPLMEVPRQR
jgi:hypothetical protein